MKTYLSLAIASLCVVSLNAKQPEAWFDNAVDHAKTQLIATAHSISVNGQFPRSVKSDYSLEQLSTQMECAPADFKPEVELLIHPSPSEYRTTHFCNYSDWTSGFFPGSLWLAYQLTDETELQEQAKRFTNMLLPVSKMTDTHDLGFMAGCSYGNALRLAPSDSIKSVLVETASNLAGRFDPAIGCIRSWDFGPWNFPVIIDNMMNLDLLYKATELTGDKRYADVATTHALTTLKYHFRADKSCFHVVSYNADGTVECRQTFQGKNDDSSWARGQGWALYGYTETYRNTGRKEFLDHAVAVAEMIISKNQTDDLVPLWDFDAVKDASTPRDASAAAVIASGLIDLSKQVKNGKKYFAYAEKILKSLASDRYLAEKGTNNGFVLMHSTGSLPHGSEIDTPLNYADYYFLEALCRYKDCLSTI
ncbi:MAG: glucuronyl hydrolase [Bacteroidales bacterium]|nr:glucuronyl hydrolase [Bacteroidales bacterium]